VRVPISEDLAPAPLFAVPLQPQDPPLLSSCPVSSLLPRPSACGDCASTPSSNPVSISVHSISDARYLDIASIFIPSGRHLFLPCHPSFAFFRSFCHLDAPLPPRPSLRHCAIDLTPSAVHGLQHPTLQLPAMLKPATPLTVLLFISFVFLLLSVLSTPVIKGIPIATFENVNFGVFGFCSPSSCSGIRVGYTTGDDQFLCPDTSITDVF